MFDGPLNGNGNKPRLDGKGDGWANTHREMDKLGGVSGIYMQDLDACFGFYSFGQNTAEKLFMEYVPDSYENRMKSVREFRCVAIFDRKKSEDIAFSRTNLVSLAFHLWLCRKLGEDRLNKPRFFFVYGSNEPPWIMQEVDVNTGEPSPAKIVVQDAESMKTVWESFGLAEHRRLIYREMADNERVSK